jgi:hypothetical protein
MSTMKVEKNISIPSTRSRSQRHFPWLDMSLGDSFTVNGKSAAASARGSFRRYQRLFLIPQDRTVLQRRVENTPDTYRLWLELRKEI